MPELPEFPGLQQEPHCGFCVWVCVSVPWKDEALYKFSYLITIRLGTTRSYRPVGQSVPQNYLVHQYEKRDTDKGVIRFFTKAAFSLGLCKDRWYKNLKKVQSPLCLQNRKKQKEGRKLSPPKLKKESGKKKTPHEI